MYYFNVEEIDNLLCLQDAYKNNDKQAISKYKKITGVRDNYETLIAKLRFMQIGIARSYKEAEQIYFEEEEIIKEINRIQRSIQTSQNFVDFVSRNERREREEYQRASDRLEDSREELETAQKRYKTWED